MGGCRSKGGVGGSGVMEWWSDGAAFVLVFVLVLDAVRSWDRLRGRGRGGGRRLVTGRERGSFGELGGGRRGCKVWRENASREGERICENRFVWNRKCK